MPSLGIQEPYILSLTHATPLLAPIFQQPVSIVQWTGAMATALHLVLVCAVWLWTHFCPGFSICNRNHRGVVKVNRKCFKQCLASSKCHLMFHCTILTKAHTCGPPYAINPKAWGPRELGSSLTKMVLRYLSQFHSVVHYGRDNLVPCTAFVCSLVEYRAATSFYWFLWVGVWYILDLHT